MKPVLSIVVPVYNAEAFVARTMENLLFSVLTSKK